MALDIGQQVALLGLEDYVCTFQCLTHCPLPPNQDCLWDDPGIGEDLEVVYPDFFWWRLNNLPEDKQPLIVTPDSMDEFYKEPEGNVQRCNRCLSTNVHFGEEWIVCKDCAYNEPLYDFPDNVLTERERI